MTDVTTSESYTWPYPYGYSHSYPEGTVVPYPPPMPGVPHYADPRLYGTLNYPYPPKPFLRQAFTDAFAPPAFDGTAMEEWLENRITENAIAMARVMLRDFPRSYTDEYVARGFPTMFHLSMGRVIADSFELWVEMGDDVHQEDPADGNYTLEPQQGNIRVEAAIPKNALLHCMYSAYEWISDESMRVYSTISFNQYKKSFGAAWPTIMATDPRYADALAMGTVVEASWALLTEAARDVDVLSPEENIPVSQRYRMLEGMVGTWTGRLKELEGLLDIGVYSTSVNWMRRVSRQTGKLVPLYQDEEYDDPHRPSRIFTTTERPSDEASDPLWYNRKYIETYGGYDYGTGTHHATPTLPGQGA